MPGRTADLTLPYPPPRSAQSGSAKTRQDSAGDILSDFIDITRSVNHNEPFPVIRCKRKKPLPDIPMKIHALAFKA